MQNGVNILSAANPPAINPPIFGLEQTQTVHLHQYFLKMLLLRNTDGRMPTNGHCIHVHLQQMAELRSHAHPTARVATFAAACLAQWQAATSALPVAPPPPVLCIDATVAALVKLCEKDTCRMTKQTEGLM